jgi:hypothetical protein
VKSFLNLFRRNWGLKLLALILSFVIYYTMRDSTNSEDVTTTRDPTNSKDVSNTTFLKGAPNGGTGK